MRYRVVLAIAAMAWSVCAFDGNVGDGPGDTDPDAFEYRFGNLGIDQAMGISIDIAMPMHPPAAACAGAVEPGGGWTESDVCTTPQRSRTNLMIGHWTDAMGQATSGCSCATTTRLGLRYDTQVASTWPPATALNNSQRAAMFPVVGAFPSDNTLTAAAVSDLWTTGLGLANGHYGDIVHGVAGAGWCPQDGNYAPLALVDTVTFTKDATPLLAGNGTVPADHVGVAGAGDMMVWHLYFTAYDLYQHCAASHGVTRTVNGAGSEATYAWNIDVIVAGIGYVHNGAGSPVQFSVPLAVTFVFGAGGGQAPLLAIAAPFTFTQFAPTASTYASPHAVYAGGAHASAALEMAFAITYSFIGTANVSVGPRLNHSLATRAGAGGQFDAMPVPGDLAAATAFAACHQVSVLRVTPDQRSAALTLDPEGDFLVDGEDYASGATWCAEMDATSTVETPQYRCRYVVWLSTDVRALAADGETFMRCSNGSANDDGATRFDVDVVTWRCDGEGVDATNCAAVSAESGASDPVVAIVRKPVFPSSGTSVVFDLGHVTSKTVDVTYTDPGLRTRATFRDAVQALACSADAAAFVLADGGTDSDACSGGTLAGLDVPGDVLTAGGAANNTQRCVLVFNRHLANWGDAALGRHTYIRAHTFAVELLTTGNVPFLALSADPGDTGALLQSSTADFNDLMGQLTRVPRELKRGRTYADEALATEWPSHADFSGASTLEFVRSGAAANETLDAHETDGFCLDGVALAAFVRAHHVNASSVSAVPVTNIRITVDAVYYVADATTGRRLLAVHTSCAEIPGCVTLPIVLAFPTYVSEIFQSDDDSDGQLETHVVIDPTPAPTPAATPAATPVPPALTVHVDDSAWSAGAIVAVVFVPLLVGVAIVFAVFCRPPPAYSHVPTANAGYPWP